MRAIIYEKETDTIISIKQGDLVITNDRIRNEFGVGIRGIKQGKIGYVLLEDEDELPKIDLEKKPKISEIKELKDKPKKEMVGVKEK